MHCVCRRVCVAISLLQLLFVRLDRNVMEAHFTKVIFNRLMKKWSHSVAHFHIYIALNHKSYIIMAAKNLFSICLKPKI